MKLSRFVTIAVLIGALAAAGCGNTIRGMGKDAANTVDAAEDAGNSVANAVE